MNMKKGIWGVLLLLAVVVYFGFDPSGNAWFPKCPFLMLTGWKCPGCGSQRAIHSLLHLDVLSALRYNFLLVASLPVLAVLLCAEAVRESRPMCYAKVHRVVYIWIYFVIVCVWWLLRNVFDW